VNILSELTWFKNGTYEQEVSFMRQKQKSVENVRSITGWRMVRVVNFSAQFMPSARVFISTPF
jgi:hypothetical protein